MGGERGFDSAKKVKGRKRHVVVDSLGLLLAVAVTAAGVDDGAAAPQVLAKLDEAEHPRLEVIRADPKYHNHRLGAWLQGRGARYRIEVVRRPEGARGFGVVPKRWVVERSIGWWGRYRRLSKDYEYDTGVSEAWIQVCAVHQMVRRYKPDHEHPQPAFKYPKPRKRAA
jgi:putative transposase